VGVGTKLRFGDYELDSRAGKLSRDDRRVKIQPQPLRVLAVLLERRGEIVSREELKARIWDGATFVEFDQGLNYCIRQIRLALRDDASEPVYIETLPRQGYRFIAPVVVDAFPPSAPIPSNGTQAGDTAAASSTMPDKPRRRRSAWRTAAAIVFLTLAGAALWWIGAFTNSSSTGLLQVTHLSKLTSYPGDEREPAISPDGRYVAFSWSGEKGENYDIYMVQAGGQRPLRLTQDPAPDSFPAWSPDGRQIAFVRRKGPLAEIMVNSSLGGSERSLYKTRMGSQLDLLQHPVLNWSPDGRWIVFSGQSADSLTWRLWALSVETGAAHRISQPEGNVLGDSSPALSPDGKFLAFVRYHGPVAGQILIQALGQKMIPIGMPKTVATTATAVHSPIWMGDSKRLLFADRNNIFQWERNKAAVPIYAARGASGRTLFGCERTGRNSTDGRSPPSGRYRHLGDPAGWKRRQSRWSASGVDSFHGKRKPAGSFPGWAPHCVRQQQRRNRRNLGGGCGWRKRPPSNASGSIGRELSEMVSRQQTDCVSCRGAGRGAGVCRRRKPGNSPAGHA